MDLSLAFEEKIELDVDTKSVMNSTTSTSLMSTDLYFVNYGENCQSGKKL